MALYCDESPEVWFRDVMRVPITGCGSHQKIDVRFMDVCERNSIVVTSLVPNRPVPVSGTISRGCLNIMIPKDTAARDKPTEVVASIAGIRKGFSGVRFPNKTKDEMVINNAFWSKSQTRRP